MDPTTALSRKNTIPLGVATILSKIWSRRFSISGISLVIRIFWIANVDAVKHDS